MAIIPGIQICIPQWTQRADVVIKSMERLLAQRKYGYVSRRAFLVAWNKKRVALRLTYDYQKLQQRVRDESRGQCEVCHERSGDHMHHLTPVAFEPRRALDRSNVIWVCVVCHEDEDEAARQRALKPTRAFKREALPAQLGTLTGAESGAAKRPIPTPEASR